MSTEQREAQATTDGADVTEVADGTDVFRPHLVSSLLVAAFVGTGLAVTADLSAVTLLIGVAVLQSLVAVGWVLGTGMPGRKGGLVLAAMAASGADVTCSVWPHSRLGALVAIVGLALPVMFVHQLSRGAARTNLVASLSAVAAVVIAVIAPAALLQLRHESVDPTMGGRVVAAVVAAAAGALVIGYLVDLVVPVPRFDPEVPRGLLAIVASAAVGAGVASVILRDQPGYAQGRAGFIGAAVGAVAGLLAIATTFVLFTTPEPVGRVRWTARPVFAALLPICLLAPAAFLLCLAIRT